MDKIDEILTFLDGLPSGSVMAQTIRKERKTLEQRGISEPIYSRDIKENFETFLCDYDLEPYREKLEFLLTVCYYSNSFYHIGAGIAQRRQSERVNATMEHSKNGTIYYPKKNNPLKKDLEIFKNTDFSVLDLSLGELAERYPNQSFDKIKPLKVEKVSVSIGGKKHMIKSKELLSVVETALSNELKKHSESGTLEKLQNGPSKRKMINRFAQNYLIPVYWFFREIWPGKSNPFLYRATVDFWGVWYPEPKNWDTFRKEILGH